MLVLVGGRGGVVVNVPVLRSMVPDPEKARCISALTPSTGNERAGGGDIEVERLAVTRTRQRRRLKQTTASPSRFDEVWNAIGGGHIDGTAVVDISIAPPWQYRQLIWLVPACTLCE